VDRIHSNKNFGSNSPAHLKNADTVIHVPVKDVLNKMGKENAWVVLQTGISKPMEDFYGHGFKARFKVKHSVRMPYKMAEDMFGDLTINSYPIALK
jgi:hypothetical protein